MSLNDASELRGGDDSRAIVGGALVGAQRGVSAFHQGIHAALGSRHIAAQ